MLQIRTAHISQFKTFNWLHSFLLIILITNCNHLTGYKVSGDEVYWHSWNEGEGFFKEKLENAEASTFAALSLVWGKDSKNVYHEGIKVKGADPRSFSMLNNSYGIDNQRVFFKADEVIDADVKTFKVLDLDMGYDDVQVFSQGLSMNVCHRPSFQHVKGSWYKDKKCMYHDSSRVSGADSKTFIILNDSLGKDSKHVYYTTMLIRGAHAPTFILANTPCEVCGKDKFNCYVAEKFVPCESFKSK